jgi:hypothetical protein
MPHRRVWRYVPAPNRMVGDATHGAPGDRGHGLQQMAGLRIPVQSFRYFYDALRQMRRRLGHHSGDLGQRLPGGRQHCPGHDWQQFAGSHADQRQKVLGSFVFALRFRRQFTQVLHHGVWINLADGVELFLVFAFVLIFGLIFIFAFSEQAAGDIAQGAQPAFAFQAGLVFHFVFRLVFEFSFELVFELGFQFTFICHDEASCEKWSNLLSPAARRVD